MAFAYGSLQALLHLILVQVALSFFVILVEHSIDDLDHGLVIHFAKIKGLDSIILVALMKLFQCLKLKVFCG